MKRILLSILVFAALLAANNPVSAQTANKTVLDLPTSEALPAGMVLVWSDEFNGESLDRNKWSTNYYSTIDFVLKTNYEKLITGKLPQPGIRFTGHSIVLETNDSIPNEIYFPDGRKISSIQTYDWNEDKLYLDNGAGGFLEARIKRSSTADAERLNGAFWLDSPGPDAKYFVEQGNTVLGVTGIRPRGQVFEIDLCENMNTEIVLHGNVSPEGVFERNIGHYPIPGEYTDRWVTHSMLWSPAGFKFYIDGKLMKEDRNPHNIKSPNHAMSIFLGMYAKGGTATMEVDYIRYYRWKTEGANELPNSGFEYHDGLFPWEGNGKINSSSSNTGKHGVELAVGDSIFQYVYLDHSHSYEMKFMAKGSGTVTAKIENITPVVGFSEDRSELVSKPAKRKFKANGLRFSTGTEYGSHKKTVKVTFVNHGTSAVSIDDIVIMKRLK